MESAQPRTPDDAERNKRCVETQDAPTANDGDETTPISNGDDERDDQPEQEHEPDVQSHGADTRDGQDDDAHKVAIVETIEKPAEIPQTVEEIVPCSTFDAAPEAPMRNGHGEPQETPVVVDPAPIAPRRTAQQDETMHRNDDDEDDVEEEEEEPVRGQYQPEKVEIFGISVREMISERLIEDEMKAPKESMPNGPRKGAMATSMDTESVRDAYNDIRADSSDTTWAVFKYEASRIVCSAKGVAFDEFKKQFDEGERAYGYIRLQTGDEMSKRHKFLFVTWIGPGVSVLKRAKMSIDKAIIKNVVSNFAVELQLETLSEFDLPFFIESLNKASGANYGTGVREI